MIHLMPRTLRFVLVALVAVGYLLLAHLTTAPDRPSTLGALVAVLPLMLFGFVMAWRSSRAALGLWLAGMAALAWAWPLLEARFEWVYFIQHVGAFSLLAIVFARTLAEGEVPMITRFARLVHGASLAPELLPYTRARCPSPGRCSSPPWRSPHSCCSPAMTVRTGRCWSICSRPCWWG